MTGSDFELGVRGCAVFAAYASDGDDAAHTALIVETARLADRLEELNRVIQGKGVLDLMRFRLHESWGDQNDRTVRIEVKFDSVLAEARQSQMAFERLSRSLGAASAVKPKAEVDPSDDLAAKRAARRRAAGS